MEAQPFSLLAEVYDAIMSDVEYEDWAEFALALAFSAGTNTQTVLDLGCGTGNSSAPFVRDGLGVMGIDRSPEMLAVARRKLPEATFLEADFTAFSLERTFDLVVSIFDSLNNLLDPEDFVRCAERARAHLNPGGAFIFDVNTTVGLRDLWEGNRAEGWVDDVYYRWEHSFDEAARRAKVVAYCEKGARSFTETHLERPYDPDELDSLLKRAGFGHREFITYPHGYPATAESERIWVLAQP